MNAIDYIETLNLQKHPEGGYYKENYRANGLIPQKCLPDLFTGDRSYSTAIYYLLQQGDYSGFHKINSDECWHFYAGGPLWIHIIEPSGAYKRIALGSDILNGQTLQYVVPATAWFASEPSSKSSFSLVGCTVAPGFDFADFEMATKEVLLSLYPEYRTIISRLCR